MFYTVLFSQASEFSSDHLFLIAILALVKVFGSAPQIYVSNVMWLQVRQDVGVWKHHRIWSKDWECYIIAKGRVIQC